MRIVLANGCFDVFHYGHLLHLQQAKTMGDLLIVSVTWDQFVNKGPGRPVNKLEERMAVLRELRCVDAVVSTSSATHAIHAVRPQVFVKGIDYVGGKFTEAVEKACKEVGATIRYTDTPKRTYAG